MSRRILMVLFCTTALSAASPAGTAFGQQADQVVANGGGLEEIIVTAQRREQKLQNVPISVSSFDAKALNNANVLDLQDISQLDASVIIGTGTTALLPFIRGFGNPAGSAGNEASNALYVDGVYYAKLFPAFFDFNNIERIEVDKGPQGTLFGRNSDGGLIQIVTRDPPQAPTLEMSVGYGNYDTLRGNLYAASGFGDKVAGDIAVLGVDQGSGYGTNLATGHDVHYEDDFALRSKWIVSPTDDTEIKAAFDYMYSKSDDGFGFNPFRGTVQGSAVNPFHILPTLSFYDVNEFLDPVTKNQAWGASVRLKESFDFADFISLTAFRRTDFRALQDPYQSYYNPIHFTQPSQEESEELQLVSSKDSPFDWIVGFYYLNDYEATYPLQEAGTLFGSNIIYIQGRQRDFSYAGYTQETFHVLDHTDLTFGARYTIDDLTTYGRTDTQTPNAYISGAPLSPSKDFYKTTFRVGVDQHFTDDIMGYVSFSRGFKAGTFNAAALTQTPVQPETLDDYEVGAKTDWFNHHLRVNGDFFFYQIGHPQISEVFTSTTGVTTALLVNGQSASIQGFELQSDAALTDQLSVRFGTTILNARYGDFPNAPFYLPNSNPPYGNLPAVAGNATNHYLIRAPNVVFNIGANYRVPTSVGTWEANIDYSYTGQYYFNPDNAQAQKAYGLLSAGLSYMLPDNDHWRVRVWGKNLTDERYYLFENEVAGALGDNTVPAPPRTYGFTVDYKY